MRLLAGRGTAIILGLAVALAGAMSAAHAQSSWFRDPLGTEQKVSPAPEKYWLQDRPIPAVPVPETSGFLDFAHPLTLPALTEFALRNNPRTRQAWYSARAAAASLGFAQGDDLPEIMGSYAVSRQRPVSGTTGLTSPWLTRYGPAISFNYVLFDFGAGDARVEAAEYRLLAANLAHNRTLQDVIFQVEQAYYLLIGVEALVRVNEQSLRNIETALDAARRRRESGLATAADVSRTETQVAQAQLALTRSRGELEKARGQLAAVVGLPVNSALRVQTLSSPPQTGDVVSSISDYLEKMKAGRPDLLAAEAQARSARATASATAKAGLPSIEISGNSAYTEYHPERPEARSYALTLNVRIPLFTGFKDTYSTRQAEAVAAQAEAARDALYRQSALEVWQAYYDLQTVRSSISSTEAQVKSAEQTAEATLARYKSGFGTILDLITAQQDETNARTQRIQAYLDWYTVLARLSLSLGASDKQTYTTGAGAR
jgi:outer membrane protein